MSEASPPAHWFPPRQGVWPPMRVFGRAVLRAVWGPVFRLRVEGRENLPREGGTLIVANHPADVDPPFFSAACLPRDLLFLANARHFQRRALSALLFSVGGFPLRIDQVDTRAIRHARERLEAGFAVAIFPEGEASFSDRLLPFNDGVGYLALSRGTRVVPAAIWGTREIFDGRRPRRRGPVTVRFGPSFGPPSSGSRKARARATTDRARDAVEDLLRDLVESSPA